MGRNLRLEVMDEYAHWMVTPERLRISLGLPRSHTEFARLKGVDRKTLERWRKRDDFVELVEQKRMLVKGQMRGGGVDVGAVARPRAVKDPRVLRRMEVAAGSPVTAGDDPAVVAGLDAGLSADQLAYEQVKDTLVRMAQDGDRGAMDLYLKHYGQSFIEAERDELEDFVSLSDDDLVVEMLEFVGVERVAAWLASEGAVGAAGV